MHFSGSACAAAFRDRRPVLVSDVKTDGNFSEDSRQITPGGVLLGVLSIHYREPAVVSPRALALVEQVAARTAALIEQHPRWRGVPPIAAMIAKKLTVRTLLPFPPRMLRSVGNRTPSPQRKVIHRTCERLVDKPVRGAIGRAEFL